MQTYLTLLVAAALLPIVRAFLPVIQTSSPTTMRSALHSKLEPLPLEEMPPPLKSLPPRKVALMVEPTPFSYVSGYSNRYNEMLRYLKDAGDDVSIVTTDDTKDPPKEAFGYPIEHTLGFRFPLYDHVVVSFDLPEIKGLRMMEAFQPDVIHISSPGFLLFAALLYARVLKIPLLMSYHTHLPHYAKKYLGYIPGIEEFAWILLRFAHKRADLTLATSPQLKQTLEDNALSELIEP